MTVSSSTDRATFPGNGATQIFPLPFRFFANSEIQAWLVTNATGALTALTLGTHYTLSGAADPEVGGSPTSELTMLTAPTTLQSLFVQRVIPLTQPTDIVNQGRFFPEIHENVFDRLTMLMQQAIGESKGSIRVAIGDPEPTRLAPAVSRANQLMGFDSAGNPVAVAPSSGSAADLALSLLNSTDPAKGAGQVGFIRSPLAAAITTVGGMLSSTVVNVWEYADLVTVKPTPENPSTWDWSPAMQAAHDAYAVVFYPLGNEYRHSATINLTLFGSSIVSTQNKYSSAALRYTGSGTAWSATGDVNYLQVNGVHITGTPTVVTDYYNTGSIAFDTTLGATALVLDNAWLSNFETLVKSNFNSFYNQVTGCRLDSFKDGFLNISANNLVIDTTRIQRFNRLIRTSGSGPINITKSSIERFNGPIVDSQNLKVSVNFKGNYVETYDSEDIPTNFPQNTLGNPAKFGGNILFTGLFASLALHGNELQIPGSRRIGSFIECNVLSSRGNSIAIYTSGNNIDRLFTSTNPIKHVDIRDSLGGNFGAGPYAIEYGQTAISGTIDGQYEFFDCIANRAFLNPTLIVTPTLDNAWTAPDVDQGNPRLIKDGGTLRLSGMIDGSSSTGSGVFTVPTNLRPYEYGTTRAFANFSLFAGSGSGNIIRFRYLYASGVFQLEGAPASKALIPLDGIVIPERY